MADRLTLEKYGCLWNPVTDPAVIEMTMIRHGGQWTKKDGRLAGNGLFYHYRALQSLLWPEDDHHRWSDLMLKEFLQNTITAVLGPKDSGKTRTMSKFGLTDYFLYPNESLIMISSTDIRGLEYRVWGDLKGMFERAKERYDWLPGFLIDSKHAICTQNIKEDDVRDMRKGIVCFLEGTLVDTPSGQTPIESIRVGDIVISSIGPNRVKAIGNRITDKLVRIHLSNGKHIDCTPNHKFLTPMGWVDAIDIPLNTVLYSADETMQIMSRSASKTSKEVLFKKMPNGIVEKVLQILRNIIYPFRAKSDFLHSVLLSEMESIPTRYSEKDDSRKRFGSDGNEYQQVHFEQSTGTKKEKQSNEITSPKASEITKRTWTKTLEWIWNRTQIDSCREFLKSIISRCNEGLFDLNRKVLETWKSSPLQNRLLLAGNKTGGGSGWLLPSKVRTDSERQRTGHISERIRVHNIEVLKQSSSEKHGSSKEGYRVYNLEVEGHPSYSVEGVIVHNCIPCISSAGTFTGIKNFVGIKQKRRRLLGDEVQFMKSSYLESLANLNSGDFKGIFVGNPIGENDPLDKVSEPKEGWDSIGVPMKTTVWENRFVNGRTINLVGIDSPNFDVPEQKELRYKYLINQKEIDKVVSFYGKESLQYFSQCLGVRRSGIEGHRVITRQLCEQFDAFKDAVWYDTNQTRIYAVDAAYGNLGGDRCVGGWIEFGKDVDGKLIMCCHPPVIIPVSVKLQRIAEDQIAEFVKNDCESLGIPPENVFFDATGRGSLGTSFARIWSPMVNPVEFGGKPTTRPVSNDLYTYDPVLRRQRLKRCDEEYRKFVTELWFSVKYIIMSGQMCNFPLEVMEEFCLREWKTVEGNRTEIETKTETKERMGRSPDLADWMVTCAEGARQRGFIISSMANEEAEITDYQWKRELEDFQLSLTSASQLNHDC